MNLKIQITVFYLLLSLSLVKGQQQDSVVFAFYNVENLFDTVHQHEKNDLEYLPNGLKKWNSERYQTKIKNLSRVINAMNSWQGPDLIGLCEVENRSVLEDLIASTGLKNRGYKIIHRESPDQRGIDVCALYKPERFELIEYNYITVLIPGSARPTREILHLKGIVLNTDTIHAFFNHWPSRFGGEEKSRPKRLYVAELLHSVIDSLLKIDPKSAIFVAGDFNDGIENESLKALIKDSLVVPAITKNSFPGTHKYQADWNTFDQILFSKNLLNKKYLAEVFAPQWLTMPDERFTGSKPFRTHAGSYYKGGYSDHFGVKLVLYK